MTRPVLEPRSLRLFQRSHAPRVQRRVVRAAQRYLRESERERDDGGERDARGARAAALDALAQRARAPTKLLFAQPHLGATRTRARASTNADRSIDVIASRRRYRTRRRDGTKRRDARPDGAPRP